MTRRALAACRVCSVWMVLVGFVGPPSAHADDPGAVDLAAAAPDAAAPLTGASDTPEPPRTLAAPTVAPAETPSPEPPESVAQAPVLELVPVNEPLPNVGRTTAPVGVGAPTEVEERVLDPDRRGVGLLTRARPRYRRRLDGGGLLGNAIGGDLIGAAAGGLVAIAIAGGLGCTNGESRWLGGFTCGSGYLFALSFGALSGAIIGGPLGVLRAGGAHGAQGDAGLALAAAGAGLVLGTVVGAVLASAQDSPTLAVAIGGGLGVLTSTFGAVILYDGSRPAPSEERPSNRIELVPVVVPTVGGLFGSLGAAF